METERQKIINMFLIVIVIFSLLIATFLRLVIMDSAHLIWVWVISNTPLIIFTFLYIKSPKHRNFENRDNLENITN
jgi:ABC-type amino acid transport system permease subunit